MSCCQLTQLPRINNQKEKPSPPPFFDGEGVEQTTVPQIVEKLMESEQYLFTLTELNTEEIMIFGKALLFSRYFNVQILEDWVREQLVMRISKNRRGRDEIIDAIRQTPLFQRMLNRAEPYDEMQVGKGKRPQL